MFVVGGDVLALVSTLCLHRLTYEDGVGVNAWRLASATYLLVQSHVARRRQRRPDADRTVVEPHYRHLANRNTKLRNQLENKKHLKNVGPIRHNEPPHANSPDVASATVARRLHIDVHDNDNA